MENEVVFVSGQRGSGKTHWVKHRLDSIPRYLLFDSLGEYSAGVVITGIHDLIEFMQPYEKNGGFFEVVYDPPDNSTFPMFCQVAAAIGNVYVVVEEVDQFATPYQTPDEFQALMKYGRHWGVNLIAVSRRPSEVSRLFTSQANRFVLFRQFEPRDIAYFKSVLGDLAERLPGLEKWEFFDVDMEEGPPLEVAPRKLPPGV